jgi:hypothetical protein
MRKSRYGKETNILWEAGVPATNEQVLLDEVPSTLKISDEQNAEIGEAFRKAKEKNPHFFDGTLWRYQDCKAEENGVTFRVSPVMYSQHNVLRDEQNKPIWFYPNPISINAVQVTTDGYIPLGVKGVVADQKGLCTMGSGFIKRGVNPDDGKNYPPVSIFSVTSDECIEETTYNITNPENAFDIEEARALGAIFGSNHDTTICVYVPLKVESRDLDLGNKEHSDLLFLPADYDAMQRFLYESGMHGIPAADHLLGDIELFALNKMKGYLDSERQHSLSCD